MPSNIRKVEHQVSAGGVVYRSANSHFQIVLCGRKSPKLWALPKGGPDKSETLEQTALREVREETGLKTAIQAPLGKVQYSYTRTQDQVLCHKTVHFYLMVPIGGDLSLHDPEFDYIQWFSEEEAPKIMNHGTEVAMVKKALQIAKSRVVQQ